MDVKKGGKDPLKEKDIVYGYMNNMKSIFPWKDNSYYIIAQSFQHLCLLYFHSFIDAKILTDNEIDSVLDRSIE